MIEVTLRGKRPCYMCFIFRVDDASCTPSATYMESAPAVPDIPSVDYHYVEVTNTIALYPHLFRIITPVNTDHFELLLHNHPNSKLVSSVCCGLRAGFWPFANMEKLDNLLQGSVTCPQGLPALNNEAIMFLKSQCDTEMVLDRYSPSFGAKLLPSMVAQPVFTMPKKGSMKLHLVNDHSAGLNSLNSLIPTEGGFVVLNNLSNLGANIHAIMHERPGLRPKLVWKSDASQAYRHLPMHPHWQVHQVTLISSNYHVNHCAIFRNCASGHLWCLFFGLMCWIAIHECGVTFNVSFSDELSFYTPYGHLMPADQTCFLLLLDEIGVPHEDKKQLYGESLEVIGLIVDVCDMSISMSHKAKQSLIEAL